jgi:hypothetical protein
MNKNEYFCIALWIALIIQDVINRKKYNTIRDRLTELSNRISKIEGRDEKNGKK